MVKSRVRDLPEKLKLQTSEQVKRRYQRHEAKQKKIERLLDKFQDADGTIAIEDSVYDRVTEWVDEDFERMDINQIDEEYFRNSLAGDVNIPIQKTGTRWYHHQKPLGRFIKSIRESNSEHNRSTILIIRGGDESIYRLGVRKGQESTVLSTAISKGYILSEIKVSDKDE